MRFASQTLAQIVSAIVLLLAVWMVSGRLPKQANDFTEYWSSAHLLVSHQDPYNPVFLQPLEKATGRLQQYPLIMLNPPWIFAVIFPLGFVSYSTAITFWIWLNLLILMFCVRILWYLYAGVIRVPTFVWLLIGVFLPLYIQIVIGQIGAFVLLGITGFLYCQQRNLDILAGIALFLIVLKPHLASLLWIALVPWFLQNRKWKVLTAFIATMTATCLLPLAFKRDVYANYWNIRHYGQISWKEVPSIGGVIAHLWNYNFGILIPFLIAAIWFYIYWRKHASRWNWLEQTPLLLLISIVVSPYSWIFDQILFIPLILQIAANRSFLSKQKLIFATYIAINISIVVVFFLIRTYSHKVTTLFDPWSTWITVAWFGLYLLVRRNTLLLSLQNNQPLTTVNALSD